MFVRVKTTPNSPRQSVQICESRRVGEKIKQTIVRHIGIAMDDDELERLRVVAEHIRSKLVQERSGQGSLFPPESVDQYGQRRSKKRGPKGLTPRKVEDVRLDHLREEARVIEGIGQVFGPLYEQLGFDSILETKAQRHALKAAVLARVANPSSKRRTAALLEKDFGVSIPLDGIYRMMDGVFKKLDNVKNAVHSSTLDLFPKGIDLVFFDVTTLYFESITTDSLREFGYSKDQKFHSVQVVLALATTNEGLPVGYQLFAGNTAEVKTLLECIDSWKTKIKIGQVTFVADRAMMSKKNIEALEIAGHKFLIAAKIRGLPKKLKEEILTDTDFQLQSVEQDLMWLKEYEHQGRRLIVSYSSKRAKKDMADRKRIIDALQEKIGKNAKTATKKLISNKGYIKYTSCEGNSIATIDQNRIDNDAQWDGIHGVITNLDKTDHSASKLLARYRQLWTIEDAFRVSKHDLRVRPVFHYKAERIQAHIAICFLAYSLLRHAQYRIKLQQGSLSVAQIRDELLAVQASILIDRSTGGRYRLPSSMSQTAVKIYRAFGITRSLKPTLYEH